MSNFILVSDKQWRLWLSLKQMVLKPRHPQNIQQGVKTRLNANGHIVGLDPVYQITQSNFYPPTATTRDAKLSKIIQSTICSRAPIIFNLLVDPFKNWGTKHPKDHYRTTLKICDPSGPSGLYSVHSGHVSTIRVPSPRLLYVTLCRRSHHVKHCPPALEVSGLQDERWD